MKSHIPGRRVLSRLFLLEAFGYPVGRRAAEALGVSENKISRLVTGRDEPSEEILTKLEKLIGVSRKLFLGRSPKAVRS